MAVQGQPKTSGRKKGVPNKAAAEVKAVAQVHGPEAIETLAKLMRTVDSETAKIAACRELLDRAYGKPQQAVKASVDQEEKLIVRFEGFGKKTLSSETPVD